MSTLVSAMMSEPPKASSGDEICPMCKRMKSNHTNKEMLSCSKKLQEFKKKPQEVQE